MHVDRSLVGRILTVALMLTAISSAQSQTLRSAEPVRIQELFGRDTLAVGELETYRVRVNRPMGVEYRWTLGDGQEALGNPIVYQFDSPGHYKLKVRARNVAGAAVDSMVVTVLPPAVPRVNPPERRRRSDPVAATETTEDVETESETVSETENALSESVGLRGARAVTAKNTGYTWIVATYFQRPAAIALANSYRASGYRAGVLTDASGSGSTVYRVVLGQFSTREKALRARQNLLSAGHGNVLLHDLNGASL